MSNQFNGRENVRNSTLSFNLFSQALINPGIEVSERSHIENNLKEGLQIRQRQLA